eukprot:XP_011671639.1 PREDICTED: piggyBac transposable element-derived protein 4-like [Strongylocentrotus purpuratus]
MLHFANNDERIPKGQEGHHILYKIKPVMDIVQPTYQASVQPGLSLSIDESLAPFKGRLQFKQYMPLKPTKWGVKFWVLADAKSGFCLDCNVYTGRDADRAAAPGGVTSAIVKGLTRPYYASGRHVYMDNFYSSPELYDSFADNKLGACGTVRLSRRGIPDEMKAASVQSRKGDRPAFFRKGRLLGVSWHDTKRVSVLSTIHNNSTVQKEIRHRGSENGRRPIIKPKVVEQYNQHMGGIDLLDQRMSYYRYPHRHMKWYRVIYHFLMEVALVNGHIASRIAPENQSKECVRRFRQQVICGLVDGYQKVKAGRPRVLREVNRNERTAVRLEGKHFIALNPSPKYKPDCIVCAKKLEGNKRKRSQTRYFCKTCQLPMCLMICFEDYHTKVKYG